ncbi:MAG: 4-phosphoerythronate dehydrogenase [Coxiellaceae bacterium]|nr:4-phosphoerythronate dehydrogenase [Coxiellaceae bacterium]
MKLVADDKIPYIDCFFSHFDKVVLLPGEKIANSDLTDADLLLTRTVTTVNEPLLKNTAVKFVGSATTGIDHIDTHYLADHAIFFANAAGANSQAVAEYVLCAIAALIHSGQLKEQGVAGIIGYGRIGKLIASLLNTVGFTVLSYDPFVLNDYSTSLEKLLADSDVITIHTPLTKTGLYPTYHMIDEEELSLMKKNAVLINTARGSVINQNALLNHQDLILCLDVFENEPTISLELLHRLTIATPHIAGYTLEAKQRATTMIFDQAAQFFGWEKKNTAPPVIKNTAPTKISLDNCLLHYDPLAHTKAFRTAFIDKNTVADVFITERKNYVLRKTSCLMPANA